MFHLRCARGVHNVRSHSQVFAGSCFSCFVVMLHYQYIYLQGESVAIVLHMVGARPIREGTGRCVNVKLLGYQRIVSRPGLYAPGAAGRAHTAQLLSLLPSAGCPPVPVLRCGRIARFELIPLKELGRPRVVSLSSGARNLRA